MPTRGRALLVEGTLYDTSVTLINIYVPNIDIPEIKNVMAIWRQLNTEIIIWGDFNLTLCPTMDIDDPLRMTTH